MSSPSSPIPVTYDATVRQFTVRAILTGMLVGGLLSLCNIYSGLKIGWSNNMSVTAALMGFAFWNVLASPARPFSMLENNLNQTAASSAAAVSSAGLVASVPALTMLTGYQFTWPVLATWVFSVCLVGIAVGAGIRRQMLEVQKLPFPSGIAAAATLKEIHGTGSDAADRVKVLAGAGVVAALVKLSEKLLALGPLTWPGSFSLGKAGTVTSGNLTFAFEPSLLMVGVGGLIGLRAGISLLFGGMLAYGVLAPWALTHGYALPGKPGDTWFGPLNKWLLWPGVALMVTASLTSFAFSWRSIAATFRRKTDNAEAAAVPATDSGDVPRKWFFGGLLVATIFAVITQNQFFGIGVGVAFLGVMLSFALALVGARVGGETNVTPIGAMGKVTQLIFGLITPGQVAPNLMAANVTGGAASQCADLMHDLRTGQIVGAMARMQVVAQLFGALSGALVGSAAYLLLIPDPAKQLLTSEWPAPAVGTWKAVAEVFAKGISAMPEMAIEAGIIGGIAGIVLAFAETYTPERYRAWVPSPSSIGLAFILPFYNTVHMFAGAVLAAWLTRHVASWSGRFLIVAASGIIAGESLMGVGISLQMMISNW